MSDSVFQSIGATTFPLPPATEAGFRERDPARDILLDLLSAAINAELGDTWTAAVSDTPLRGTNPVQTKLPEIADLDVLRQVKTTFPLLTVGRSDTPIQLDDFSIDRLRETTRWDVDYILGPLEIGNLILVSDVLMLVARVMSLTLHQGGHLAYATQTNDDGVTTYHKNVLGPGAGCCNFSSSRLVDYRMGQAAFAGDGPKYHCCSVILETTELSRIDEGGVPAAGSFQGTNITLRTGTEEGLKTIVTAKT